MVHVLWKCSAVVEPVLLGDTYADSIMYMACSSHRCMSLSYILYHVYVSPCRPFEALVTSWLQMALHKDPQRRGTKTSDMDYAPCLTDMERNLDTVVGHDVLVISCQILTLVVGLRLLSLTLLSLSLSLSPSLPPSLPPDR